MEIEVQFNAKSSQICSFIFTQVHDVDSFETKINHSHLLNLRSQCSILSHLPDVFSLITDINCFVYTILLVNTYKANCFLW